MDGKLRPDRFTPEEFEQLRQPWDEPMQALTLARLADDYRRDVLEHFDAEQSRTLRTLLGRMIPHAEGLDLAGFIDAHLTDRFGRGDRYHDRPAEPELFRRGLAALEASAQELFGASFAVLAAEQQDSLLRLVSGDQTGAGHWQGLPGCYFFQRLQAKALHGYLSHPRVWLRIGFLGAANPEGYAWLGLDEVQARHARRPGWERF
jgi:hypothetical protein